MICAKFRQRMKWKDSSWHFVKKAESSSLLRLACMSAFALDKGANCRRRQGNIFVVAGSLARGWAKPGDVQKMGYRKSLALRFYGSSSSIMRRKSTIKPLLRYEELPVLNHCVQRAFKMRSLTETWGDGQKQNWFFYDRQTRDSETKVCAGETH